ncbi:hypothetical protein NS383_20995, partial [Pseudomonas oryzihabitans]
MQAAGLFVRPGALSAEDAYRQLQASAEPGVEPRWLAHSLELLHHQGLLAREGTAYRMVHAVDAQGAWAAWEQELEQAQGDVDRRAQATLVDTCLRALPAVLGGRRRATEVMFPDGGMSLVEGVYKDNAVSDYFNDAVVQAVLVRAAAGPTTGLRILEIGAGTGGTSARVLAALDGEGIAVHSYAYTDLSRAFLMHAREAYGAGRPYLDYRLLDIERDLAAQGLELGSYDLVIAANVLHATANIRQVLRHVKSALKGDGWLLLNELSQASLFSHLTFGLLEGWWRYQDEALRMPGTPGLSSDSWRRVLEGEGYQAVSFPCQAFHALGQQLVMARSDGV